MARGNDRLRGRTALVTGASSGLGADFARELARRGCRVVLVARRQDRLEQLAKELGEEHGVEGVPLALSLSQPGAPQTVHDRVRERGLEVDVLVNNAGFGVHGPFLDVPWEREREMLELDVMAVAHLTKLFVPDMLARGFGYVLQVASIGAYQPSPNYGTYSAAKSFVLHFGEALSYELRDTPVGVTVVSPGVTRTEFFQAAGQEERRSFYQRLTMMESPAVVKTAVDAMLARRPSVVPGLVNKVPVWMLRATPRRLQAAIANSAMTLGMGKGTDGA